MARGELRDIVSFEIASITTQLRADWRAATSAYRAPPPSGTKLLRHFNQARRAVLTRRVSSLEYIEPFLETIRQENTSGVVTQRALLAVHTFLEAGLLTLDPATEPETIVAIVRAATYCRFEVTDPAADEVVLMCILQLLVACVQCPSGGALSDEAVCEVVHSCYRISSQGSLSDLLRHQAEAGLRAMVRTLFARIPEITVADPSAAALPPDSRTGATSPPVARVHSTPWAGQKVAAAAAAAAAAKIEAAAGADAGEVPTDTKATTADADADAEALPAEGAEGAEGAASVGAASVGAAAEAEPPSTPARSGLGGGAEPEPAANGTSAAPAAPALAPYGVGCLYEVLRFLIGLIDPAEPHNPPPVREFALAALLAALRAGGAPLGATPALSTLLTDSLSYLLIANIECKYGKEGEPEPGPPTELLSLLLKTAQALLQTVGVLGSRQQEALFTRVHLALLKPPAEKQPAPPPDRRHLVLESVPMLLSQPLLSMRLLSAFDCNMQRSDLLHALAGALAAAAHPAAHVPVDTAHLLAIEALLDVLASTTLDADGLELPSVLALEAEGSARDGAPLSAADAAADESAAQLLAARRRKSEVQAAADAFNKKPGKGLAALQKAGLVSTPLDPAEVAAFLRATPQLEKAALGDFLSSPGDESASVLRAFVAQFDFSAYEIEGALRMFLQSFRLPGEAQKIDRLMEAFARGVYEANPSVFANSDAAYVLAFAIIMLNTDLHSPQIANKMTLDQFVSNNRGINNNKDLPRPFLERVYTVIQSDEIKLNEEMLVLSRPAWRAFEDKPVGKPPGGPPPPTAALGTALSVGVPGTAPSTPVPGTARSAARALPLLPPPPPPHVGPAERALRAQLFSSLSAGVLEALGAMLARADSRDAVATALEGYGRCARLASIHGLQPMVEAVLRSLGVASCLCAAAAADVDAAAAAATAAAAKATAAAAAAPAGAATAATPGADGSVTVDEPAAAASAAKRLREKCLLAGGALFATAHSSAPALTSAHHWLPVVEALCTLHEMELLPSSLCADPVLGRCWDDAKEKPKLSAQPPKMASSSSFSLWGAVTYLVGSAEPDRTAELRLQRAIEHARAEVGGYKLPELLASTTAMTEASLEALLAALLAAHDGSAPLGGADAARAALGIRPLEGEGADAAPTAPGTARRASLLLQLLAEVTIHNGHRFGALWPRMAPVLDTALGESPPRALARGAVLASLRMALRLLPSHPETLPLLLPPLATTVEAKGVLVAPAVDMMAAGIAELLQPSVVSSVDESSSRVLLALASSPDVLASKAAAAATLNALNALVLASNATAAGSGSPLAGCFAGVMSAVIRHAASDATPLEH